MPATIHRPTDRTAELPPPRVTPYFRRYVEQAAAAEGLPPDPWPAA